MNLRSDPQQLKELSSLALEDPDKAVELKRVLQKYLSRPVIFSIEGHGQTLWGAELRVCSTLFVKFKALRFTETSGRRFSSCTIRGEKCCTKSNGGVRGNGMSVYGR